MKSHYARKGMWALFISGFGAIFFFFTLLVVTIHLLPRAIEAEIQRQIAIVERSLGPR